MMRKPSDEVRDYLQGVEGVVEADRFAHHTLWEKFAEDARKLFPGDQQTRYEWKETGIGYFPCIGDFHGSPVSISILTATVNGSKLLFWYASSTYADHDLVERWLTEHVEVYASNHTDATNFHNVLDHIMWLETAA